MNRLDAALAKLNAIGRGALGVLQKPPPGGTRPIGNFGADEVGHYFEQYPQLLITLREEMPTLYADFPLMATGAAEKMVVGPNRFSRDQIERLVRDIAQIFDIRRHSGTFEATKPARPRRVFISHGRSPAWQEVQTFIEKDLKDLRLPTLELAQEANLGRTILQKLLDSAAQCDSAVIVMTAEDATADGQVRARENVIHEIGLFQGTYGPGKVCLLYEEGTNIPTNMQGLVYAQFPTGRVSASFAQLMRELTAMYQ